MYKRQREPRRSREGVRRDLDHVAADDGDHGLVLGARRVAVSYTHLRAHETVLDLVCRLLLEKKKNKTTHTLLIHTRRPVV